MPDPELLDSGGDRPPVRLPGARLRGGRRRLLGMAGTLVVVAVAGVLALQAEPGPRAAPAPTPSLPPYTPAPGLVDSGFTIVDVAATPNRVYVLTSVCGNPTSAEACRFRLLARTADGWEDLRALPVPGASVDAGLGGRLLVSGESLVVVDDTRSMAYVSTDLGGSFTPVRLREGGPIPAVPDGLVPGTTDGEPGTANGVVVLDPATGLRHPLAEQPPVGATLTVAAADRISPGGPTVHLAAGQRKDRVLVATSRDAGRSWDTVEVTRLPYRADRMTLVIPPDHPAAAYLLVSAAPDKAGGPLRLGAVWRIENSDGPWQRISWPGKPPEWMEAVGTPDGGILFADGSTGGWRIPPAGTRPLPAPRIDPRLVPWTLRRDDLGQLVGLSVTGQHLLLRGPGEEDWTVERVPA